MPITPLHIGIPGLISLFYPKKIEIASALLAAVIIDIDFFLFLMIDTPIHGFLHTFIGASIISIILIVIIHYQKGLFNKIKEWFKWETDSDPRSITIGAFIGSYSHVLLDAVIYHEMDPFYPIDGNIFYGGGSIDIFTLIYAITSLTTLIFFIIYLNKIKDNKAN